MNRLSKLVSPMTVLCFGLVLLPGNAVAKQKSLKEQLVGTWTFVAATEVQKDGTKVDRWGPNPKGMLVFDANGRYVLVIHRSDLPKFASNRVDQGTAEENKAVMRGLVVTFGTYSVNEVDKALITHVEGGSFPNLYGGGQKRIITSLTAEELEVYQPRLNDRGNCSSSMEARQVGPGAQTLPLADWPRSVSAGRGVLHGANGRSARFRAGFIDRGYRLETVEAP